MSAFGLRTRIIGDIYGDVVKDMGRLARASTGGLKDASNGLKRDLRRDVEQAGLGRRLANTWRNNKRGQKIAVYPQDRPRMNAAALVWSNAPHIIEGYDKGGMVRARRGKKKYLAIPLPTAQRLMGSGKTRLRITPDLWEKKTGMRLALVQRRGKNPLLVARGVRVTKRGRVRTLTVRKATKRMGPRISLNGLAEAPMFVLVPHIQLRKRLNVKRTADKWGAQIPRLIDQRMGTIH